MRVGKRARRSIIEAVLDKSGAEALVEIMSSKGGGIIRKEMWDFDAILIFSRRGVRKGRNLQRD